MHIPHRSAREPLKGRGRGGEKQQKGKGIKFGGKGERMGGEENQDTLSLPEKLVSHRGEVVHRITRRAVQNQKRGGASGWKGGILKERKIHRGG